jgi:hypothetical protein
MRGDGSALAADGIFATGAKGVVIVRIDRDEDGRSATIHRVRPYPFDKWQYRIERGPPEHPTGRRRWRLVVVG